MYGRLQRSLSATKVLSGGFEPVSARTVWLSLFRTKLTPLGESSGAVGLEGGSAREAAFLVEVV
jgi:hypothetical protein